MHARVSNHNTEDNNSSSYDTTKSLGGIVEAPLLARLRDEEAPLDKISVLVLGLSARGYNALRRANIHTIQQLINCTEKDLLSLRNIGVTTLYDVRNKLNSYIDTMLRTGDWDPQLIQNSDNTESSLSPPLEQVGAAPTLDEAFNELFRTLKNPRQSMIIRLRYGLGDGIPRTLEEIGQHFSITRERVRQIENKIFKRIFHPTRRYILDDIVRPFQFVLRQAGGILKEGQIAEKISEVTVLGEINPIGATRFVLGVTSQLEEIWDGIWALKECPLECFPIVTSTAAMRLEKNHSRMRYNKLVSEVRRTLESGDDASQRAADTLFIEACLQADTQFEISHDGWCVLSKWQQSYVDKIVEVLRGKNTPLHYSEIASNANTLLNGNREVPEHNIHAILQRRQDLFVWVGQGTYALVEWGIQRPTYYVEIISDILEAEGESLPADEIIRRVEEIRPCKKTSIMMYLTLNDRFAEFGPSTYGLRKWLSTKSDHTAELPDSFVDQLKKRLAISLCGNEKDEQSDITVSSKEVQEMAPSLKSERTQGILRILRGMSPGRHNMVDIIEWLITNERYDELKHVILSNTPSTAPHTLYNGTDICISCADDKKCPNLLSNKSYGKRGKILLQYRLKLSNALLAKIKEASGDELRDLSNQLLLDPIHMKLGTAYTLVVEGKTQLLREGLITAACSVLRKDHGQYCPYDDIWELTA